MKTKSKTPKPTANPWPKLAIAMRNSYRVTPNDMMADFAHITEARWAFATLAREKFGLKWWQIGDAIGLSAEAVRKGASRIRDLATVDPKVKSRLDAARRVLG